MTRTRGLTLCLPPARARRPGPSRAGHTAPAHRAVLRRRYSAPTPPYSPQRNLGVTPQPGAVGVGIAGAGL